jgi:hypothetical protein
MNKPIVTVQEKKYSVSSVSVVLKLNSGPLIHLRLSEKLDGTGSKQSNEETFKTEFFQDVCQEVEGSFAWGGQTIKFILVGYDNSESRTFELVGLVIKKDVIEWLNQNNFKDKNQDYLIYQKSNEGNSWPWLNKVLGDKFEPPTPDFIDKIKSLFPDNACIWRYRDSNNFHFLNRTIAFASRHLPEVQGWCAFDCDKPLRLILFEEKKQDNSIPKLDQTWNPSHLFLPNRYSWNRWLDRSCTLSRDLNINTGQEIALIKQLVSDGSNGEDAEKGKNFQAQNPTRLLFTPGTINIGDRNIFCHTVSYEFKLPGFENKELPSVTMKIEMDYPERQIGDNEVVSLRLQGKFQTWEKEKDEETKVKIAPPDLKNWGIIDEKTQTLKSGNDAVLSTQILSRTYSDKKYSGIYIKHEKDDEMIVDIHPCGIPLVLGSVQKYRPELEKADITLCGEKLAISVSSHSQSLASAEAIILDNSEIKLNHGKKIFGQAQQKVDFLSQNIELGSTQIEINSGQAKINSLVNVSFPSPKVPTPNVPSSSVAAGLASREVGRGSDRSVGNNNSSPSTNGATSSGDYSSNNNVNLKGADKEGVVSNGSTRSSVVGLSGGGVTGNNKDKKVSIITTRSGAQFNVGNAIGENNLCLLDSLSQLLNSIGHETTPQQLKDFLVEANLMQVGPEQDFYDPDITQSIAAAFNITLQPHVRNSDGSITEAPPIGNQRPTLHVLHETVGENTHHFSPLFDKNINSRDFNSDTDSDNSEYQDNSGVQERKRKAGDFYTQPPKRTRNDGITSPTDRDNKIRFTTNKLFDGTEKPKEYGVTIEKETIEHVQGRKIERPVKVSGLVYPTTTQGRKDAPESVSGIRTGAKKFKDDVPPHRNTGIVDADKGHIMALELGGPDIPDNIVPQWSQWQRNGEWRKTETAIRKLAEEAEERGNKLYFEATVEYKTYKKVEQGTQKGISFPNKFKIVVTERDESGNDVPASQRIMFQGEQKPDETDEKERAKILDKVDYKTETIKKEKKEYL